MSSTSTSPLCVDHAWKIVPCHVAEAFGAAVCTGYIPYLVDKYVLIALSFFGVFSRFGQFFFKIMSLIQSATLSGTRGSCGI
jgi:hypothetical protein